MIRSEITVRYRPSRGGHTVTIAAPTRKTMVLGMKVTNVNVLGTALLIATRDDVCSIHITTTWVEFDFHHLRPLPKTCRYHDEPWRCETSGESLRIAGIW